VDEDRRTPLHGAADVGSTDVARLLLDRGADPDAAARYDLRPLHAVASRGDTAMADLLLRHGADSTLADSFGWTPVQVASHGPHTSLIDLFRAGGTRPSPVIPEVEQLAQSHGEQQGTVERDDVRGSQRNVE
jgi:ankyrin repeat protein